MTYIAGLSTRQLLRDNISLRSPSAMYKLEPLTYRMRPYCSSSPFLHDLNRQRTAQLP